MSGTMTISSPGQDLQFRLLTAPKQEPIGTGLALQSVDLQTNNILAATQSRQPAPSSSTWSSLPGSVQRVGPARVTGLDKWEGKVLNVDEDIFTAELYPLDREGVPITADFGLELLGSDAPTIVPGDVFYLSVRTVKARGMRPLRTENLRLRRLGRITPEEVQAAYAKADILMERLEHLFD